MKVDSSFINFQLFLAIQVPLAFCLKFEITLRYLLPIQKLYWDFFFIGTILNLCINLKTVLVCVPWTFEK